MTSIIAGIGERTRLARIAAGLSQSELARRADISRQALSTIESGGYQPGVAVAIRLARELGRTVEDLFGEGGSAIVAAAWIGSATHRAPERRTRVALGRVGTRVIATPLPLSLLSLAPAAGLVERAAGRRVMVETFRSREEIDSTVLIAGCDPAVTVLADWLVRRRVPVEIAAIRCSSRAALEALGAGRVHLAGVHLYDPDAGDYNQAPVRRELHGRRATLVNFASWEVGLALHPRASSRLGAVEDLAHPGVRIVNRERGSGARLALDQLLSRLGIEGARVSGYERELGGHLEVAAAVAAGEADAGMTIRVAAEAYALGFLKVREERYDLVVPEREMEAAPVRALLDALNSTRFARELSGLCGYDTSLTGSVIAN